jgi:hypothetical protein
MSDCTVQFPWDEDIYRVLRAHNIGMDLDKDGIHAHRDPEIPEESVRELVAGWVAELRDARRRKKKYTP